MLEWATSLGDAVQHPRGPKSGRRSRNAAECALAAEALNLETEISNLVNEAYGLTPDEVALLWQTAPPRMPIPVPVG